MSFVESCCCTCPWACACSFAALHVVLVVFLVMLSIYWPALLCSVWRMPSCVWWSRAFLCVWALTRRPPCDLLPGGMDSSAHPMLATVCVWGETRGQRAPASHASFLCVNVMHHWLPHLSVICSVRPSSCSPLSMAHMCLTAAPPALLNLSFLSFAVLSLFSSLLSCNVRANKTTTRLVIGPKYNELRDWHHGVSARALNVQ